MTTSPEALSNEVIEKLAAFIAGDTHHQSIALAMPSNGLQQLKERAHRFFELRRALRVDGWNTEDEIRSVLAQTYGAKPSSASR